MKLYLAHSVHEREKGKRVQKLLEDMGFTIWNPFYPPEEYMRNDIKDLDEGNIQPWDIINKDKSLWIIKVDLRAVGWSDMVVCLYPNRRTVGIPCEMTYAWMSHIPVVVTVPPDMIGHPWIVGMCDAVFDNEADLLEHLQYKVMVSTE